MSSTTAGDRAPLADRAAVVTGASRGIGLEIARALHRAGARVVMPGRDMAALGTAAAEFGGGRNATAIDFDLAAPRAAQRAATETRAWIGGPPDILVNNAAMFFVSPAHKTALEDFERAIAVNLVSHFALVRAFLGDMRERASGHVVTIGSLADHTPLPGNAAYAASKHGLRGLHEVLREELRGSGVRATLVSPDRVDTTIWNDARPPEWERVKSRDEMIAAADVADAVLFALTRPARVNVDELRLSRS